MKIKTKLVALEMISLFVLAIVLIASSLIITMDEIDIVLTGSNTYFDQNVSVNSEAYYGYYQPTETGMLFAGKPKADESSVRQYKCHHFGTG